MANISFGNVSIDDFSRRTGWSFSDPEREWLEAHRQDNVKIAENEFHIFDKPFAVIVGDDILSEFMEFCNRKNKESISKEHLQVRLV